MEYKLFFDYYPQVLNKETSKIMEFEQISEEEKAFIERYSIRLQLERKRVEEKELIAYTKIPMAYAIKHKLPFLSLTFHPLSLAARKYFESEETDKSYTVIESIIVWETTEETTYLSSEELEAVIKHFRTLEK